MHMAAIEWVHQVLTLDEREPDEKELDVWGPFLEMNQEGKAACRGKEAAWYLEQMRAVRNRTESELQKKADDWLDTESIWGTAGPVNYRFLWLHVMEDEISHRGQIRMMKRMMKDKI